MDRFIQIIARSKGWEYVRRPAKIERKYGYRFIGVGFWQPDLPRRFQIHIKTENLTEAVARLPILQDVVSHYQRTARHTARQKYEN